MNKKTIISLTGIKRLFILCIIYIISCSNSKEAKKPNNNQDTDIKEEVWIGKKWNLVFEEDFEKNFDKWDVWDGGAFNKEIQLYQKEQIIIDNSLLTIKAEKKDVQGPTSPYDETQKSFQYVSGRIETKQKFGPSSEKGENEYRFISRIKMPAGNGMWPAFWSYSDPWPTNGEIDIIEARGNKTKAFQSNIFYGREVNNPLTKSRYTEKVHNIGANITEDFHEYELIWSKKSLIIKFDNKVVHRYKADSKNYISSLFNKKQKLVLNLAVGGLFFEGAKPSSFANSSEMIVDWVRVYKR